MDLIYWLIRSSSRRLAELDGDIVVTLLKYMKIWCNIQVVINRFLDISCEYLDWPEQRLVWTGLHPVVFSPLQNLLLPRNYTCLYLLQYIVWSSKEDEVKMSVEASLHAIQKYMTQVLSMIFQALCRSSLLFFASLTPENLIL